MKDEIKEIKIGMYSTDEILEFMTNGEGRGFLGRSMYDAIIDYITNLQEELKYQEEAEQEYNEKHTKLMKKYKDYKSRNEKAIEYINKEIQDMPRNGCSIRMEEIKNILQGVDKE